ncbi:SAM-dependent methyltransferase [Microbacterium testaceum StLB037]|uniref:SAM-dependent methyltransferase n=1 Tax=Microbacterium testaceum (strain StLB037) TaxID=979556 RepID=E8N9P1_MICTS|nr:hypothetical protein [Microbacterium testaceum]BAJ73288.1 SAM-dependent methyltransferase [Microbacterium testaceum StLB037]
MTRYRAFFPLALIAVVFSTTGCVQWGEYAMGGECAGLSQRVSDVVDDAYGTTVTIDDLWAGESDVWCRFDVVTGENLPEGDPQRRDVADRVLAMVNDFSVEGVEVALRYTSGSDTIVAAPTECVAAARDAQARVAAHYGLASAPAIQWGQPGTLACRFSLTIDRDLPYDAEERAGARDLVRATLTPDVEVSLVYPDSRDTIVIDSRGN